MTVFVLSAIGAWLGLLLLFTYELITLYQRHGMTMSEIVWRVTVSHPILAFAAGLLMGHFFWQSASVYLGRCH